MDAVILAAGFGSRIRDIHHLPKGFIQINRKPIIQTSVEKLISHDIERILIVTGYAAQHYNAFFANKKNVTTLFNPHYHCSGSLYSLYCAREWVQNDFLVLESDIIYESRALELILQSENKNVILLSGTTFSGDEVYVEAHNKKLINMSKNKNNLNSDKIIGEFVGINKLSLHDYQQLISDLNHNPEMLMSGHYEEQGLASMAKNTDVFCLKEDNLMWCEIDNKEQFERAEKLCL